MLFLRPFFISISASRNVSSAKQNNKRNAIVDFSTEKSVTQALNSLSGVAPLNHQMNSKSTPHQTIKDETTNNSSLLGLRNGYRPPGSHAQRRQFSSQSSTSTALGWVFAKDFKVRTECKECLCVV
jgi:hypothetical protein